jgi:hypothetical protein
MLCRTVLFQQQVARVEDMKSTCFICGQAKIRFDRASDEPNGFKRHYKEDHNIWDYLAFIVFIQEQDRDDDDGLELYVRQMIENKDIAWFPMGKAIALESGAKNDDASVEEHLDRLEASSTEALRSQNELLLRAFDKSTENLQKVLDSVQRKQDHTYMLLMDKLKRSIASVSTASESSDAALLAQALPAAEQSTIAALTAQRDAVMRASGGGGGDDASLEAHLAASRDELAGHARRLSRDAGGGNGAGGRPGSSGGGGDGNGNAAQIKVTIADAQGLAPPHLFGTGDHFVFAKLTWAGAAAGTSDTVWMAEAPEWRQKANTFSVKLPHGLEAAQYRGAVLRVELQHVRLVFF